MVAIGNGKGLPVSHTGSGTISLSQDSFSLNNLLCVPGIASNLLSVNRFCKDNSCIFVFGAEFFSIRDRLTGPGGLQWPQY